MAVRSFVGGERLEVFTVEVFIIANDACTVANEHWKIGDRNSRDIAEAITAWIELRCDIENTRDLEGVLSIWDDRS
jgi:hypothetical protein